MAHDGGTRSLSVWFSTISRAWPASEWSKMTHQQHVHIPAVEKRGAFLCPRREQSGCSAQPLQSHPTGREIGHETAPSCKGDCEMQSSLVFFFLWVVTWPAKNCISTEAGVRQCEGGGSPLDASHPTLLHRWLLLFPPLNPRHFLPCAPQQHLQTSSPSPFLLPRFHVLAQNSLVLLSHSLLLPN